MLWSIWFACTPEPAAVSDDDTRVDQADDGLTIDSNQTRLCVTPGGLAFVFWVDDRRGPGLRDLWMTRSDDLGRTWFGTPARVNRGNGLVRDPAVACSDQGVVAVWTDDRDSDRQIGNIYANVLLGDGEFREEDVAIDGDPLAIGHSQDAVVAVRGDLIGIAWADSRNGAYDVYFARSVDFGQTFAPPLRLGQDLPGDAYSGQPSLALGPAGEVWVAWEDTRDGESDIYVQGSRTSGSTFDAPFETRLDRHDGPGTTASVSPQLCADQAGAVAVWQDGVNGEDDILSVNNADGQGWTVRPIALETDNPGFHKSKSPRCVADGATTHVVWVDTRSGGADLYYRTLESGVPRGTEEVRVDRGQGPGAAVAVSPVIAMAEDGPVVAWLDDRLAIANGRDQVFNNVYYNYMDATGAWGAEDFRADAGPDGAAIRTDLNLAVIGRTAFLAWTDNRDGTDDVYVRVLELGRSIEGPSQ